MKYELCPSCGKKGLNTYGSRTIPFYRYKECRYCKHRIRLSETGESLPQKLETQEHKGWRLYALYNPTNEVWGGHAYHPETTEQREQRVTLHDPEPTAQAVFDWLRSRIDEQER
jgi:DNA-directed RNA polymerase subunit RPC12/RpoP